MRFSLLLVTCLFACSGGALLLGTSPSRAEPQAGKNYWRHHDGHWSYWDAADNRWYYTNGEHWFYNQNNKWYPYRFDKSFGRTGFERGKYVVPAENANIVVPAHGVYVPG